MPTDRWWWSPVHRVPLLRLSALDYLVIALMPESSGHKVGRVQSFLCSRRNWDSPTPSPPGECALPLWFWGKGYTRWRERGRGGRVPIPTRGHTLWYSYIYVLCASGVGFCQGKNTQHGGNIDILKSCSCVISWACDILRNLEYETRQR
jgi:hypothetical protein